MLKVLDKIPKIFRHIYTMLLVLISWVIFAFEDLGQVGRYLSAMFGLSGVNFANAEAVYYLNNYIVIIIIGIICSVPMVSAIKHLIDSRKEQKRVTKVADTKNSITAETKNSKIKSKGITLAVLASIGYVAILILCTASLVNNSFNPFLYFRF